MSRIATPEVIGISSTVVSLATIVATIAALGIPNAIPRFLGMSFTSKKLGIATMYLRSSLLWISIGIAVSSAAILIIHFWIVEILEIEFSLVIVAILLISSSNLATLLRTVVISSLKTRILSITTVISAVGKLASAIILVIVGLGALGVMLGFTLFSVITSIILAAALINIFRPNQDNRQELISLRESSKQLLTASGASWIPAIVYTIGVHLGPVLVFGSQGAGEAGVYYMAFAILLAMAAITQVLFSIGYPMLSGMQDGRKRFIWQATKMTLIISLPLSSAIIFYAQDIMALFGDAYRVASLSLAVLLSSVLPITLANCVTTLTYAYGNYRQVLAIGLASNVPRAVLYILLLPIYGNLGAAVAYSIGSVIGLVISVIIAEKLKMKILWRQLTLLIIIPSGIALPLSYLGINYVLGIAVSLIISYVLFIRLHLLTRSDFEYLLDFLPSRLSNKITAVLDSIDKLRGTNQ